MLDFYNYGNEADGTTVGTVISRNLLLTPTSMELLPAHQ